MTIRVAEDVRVPLNRPGSNNNVASSSHTSNPYLDIAGNNPKPPKNYRKKKQRRRNDDNNSSDERGDADDATSQARAALAAIETRPEDEADLLETETHNVCQVSRRTVDWLVK